MKKHLKLLAGVVVAVVISVSISCYMQKPDSSMPAGYKVGVVDVQQIVLKSSEVKNLRAKQEKEMAKLQEWLGEVKTKIEKETNAEKKEKLVAKYNDEFTEKQQDIRADYEKRLQAIDKDVSEIIADEANAMGYKLIVSKGVVLFGGDDITDEIADKIK